MTALDKSFVHLLDGFVERAIRKARVKTFVEFGADNRARVRPEIRITTRIAAQRDQNLSMFFADWMIGRQCVQHIDEFGVRHV